MNRKEAEAYAQGAIEALELCKTDADLVAWDNTFSTTWEYMMLPLEFIAKMEKAYADRIAHVAGWGAG